jgi:hypothetical protein
MSAGCSRPLGAKQLWKTVAPPRVKFFLWLVMRGRCWTAHRRWRHGPQESNTCIICDQAVETKDHIILGCVFSSEVWASCLRRFRLQDRVLVQESDIMQWWMDSRRCLPKSIRHGFNSLFFLVGWTLKEMREPSMGRQGRRWRSCFKPLKMRLPCGLRQGTSTWARWTRFVGRIEDGRIMFIM